MFGSKEQIRQYKRNIRHIIQFFQGETKKILKELEVERDELSRNEYFEKASQVQEKINKMMIIFPVNLIFCIKVPPRQYNILTQND